MPVPSPRNPILPARGNYADLNANVAALSDGEICYAIDQDIIYMKEGSVLVPVGSGNGGAVDSVNGQTGVVVLDTDDISDTAAVNKFATQAELDKLAGIEAGATNVTNNNQLINGAGYITDAGVTQIIAGANVTISPVGGTGAVTVNAAGGAGGTNLGYTAAATTGTVTSDTGTDATVPAATTSLAGLLTGADKTKLDGIETGATADQTTAEIKTAYESNLDTNAFTDAEQSKLAGIEAGAQVNTVDSVAGKTGAVTLVKGDVGLGNVDNTSDLNKPISTATQGALDLKADLVGGVIPNSQLPSLAITEYLGPVASEAAMLALTGQRGDWTIRTDVGSTWVITNDGGSLISDWTELATPASAVTSVNGYQGTVVLSAADVGAATAAQGALADSALQPSDIGVSVQGYDATILKSSDIGVTVGDLFLADINVLVQPYDPDTAKLDLPQTFTAVVRTTERTITAGSFDLATGNHWTCGAITVPAPTNAVTGTSGLIRITAGPVLWNAVFKFPGGSAPTISAFPAVIPFYVQDSSNILMGNTTEGIG